MTVVEALRKIADDGFENSRDRRTMAIRELIPLAEAQEREIAELQQSIDFWKKDALALTSTLRDKEREIEEQKILIQQLWERYGEAAMHCYEMGNEQQSEIERLREALEKLQAWPPCYPANANIERMREYARAALHPTKPNK
jgi:chromosome segregation ATPase